MLRIACIDDDSKVTDLLRSYLERYGAEHDRQFDIKTFGGGWKFLEEKETFDIAFIDIDMPGIDGLSVARDLRKNEDGCMIIFLTNWAQYALDGYEVNAFDYLVKPLTYEKFGVRFKKAAVLAESRQKENIVIVSGYAKKKINIRNLFYIEVRQHKLIYHTASGLEEAWGSMRETAEKLKNFGFSLCNASFLVNLRYVTKIDGELLWVGSEKLKISRNKKRSFMDDLTSYRHI